MMRNLNLLASIQALPRDLRLLFLSLFLWTFGLGVYNYVWSIYLRNLGALPEQVGLVYSVGFLAAAASMIPGGLLANKYELRTLIIISWAMSLTASNVLLRPRLARCYPGTFDSPSLRVQPPSLQRVHINR